MNLNKLAELVRGVLPKLVRNIIGALITLDVHARDIVSTMVKNQVKEGWATWGGRTVEWGKNGQIEEGVGSLRKEGEGEGSHQRAINYMCTHRCGVIFSTY